MTGLVADLRVVRGDFTLDLDLRVAPSETVALLGPNGAGKTTALRALAGLLALTGGRIELDGVVLDAPGDQRFTPPDRRPLGMVFQDYLLFGHLSVLENVAFGLRARGVPANAARARAREWITRVGIAAYAASRPGTLSGGQQQRVALARALVTEPRLLLLDEPLAALDAATRLEVRAELRRHLAAYPGATVLVTHDALDAMILADRIMVIEDGRLVQEGAPAAVAQSPRTSYVARLVGLNLHRGRGDGTAVHLIGGGTLQVAEPVSGDVFVSYPPTAVSLHAARPPGGSPRNCWPGVVDSIEEHAGRVRVHLAAQPPVIVDVTPAAVADLGLTPGAEVWASLKATEANAYPA